MAQLTSDIVWLVEKTITLPDGTTTKALVPQLYVRVREGDLQSGGALLAANNIQLDLTGDLNNSGTIASRQVVALTADNIKNLGGRILGADVAVAARTDLDNLGGVIAADNNLIASAGRDLNVTTVTRTQTNAQGSQTNLARVAGLYVTGGTGVLVASAGRNANLIAADIQNQGTGDTAISAANNLNLGTVVQGSSNRIVWDSKNTRSDSSAVDIGTSIQTQGNLTLAAGNDLNARAANVISSQGNLLATAGNDVNLIAGQANVQVDEAHQHKGRSSAFSRKTITTRDTLDQTTAQASTFSGNTTTVLADRDINLTGSNVVSDNGTTLAAQNNLNITAATNTTVENHFRKEKKSGMFSGGGIGVTLGTQQKSTDQKSVTTTAAASTVGSTQGNVDLQAGKNYTQTGSDVLAVQGDINIRAQKVDITEARETSNNQIESKFKQSGMTVAITSPVISAIQTAQQMRKAASDTSDPRMKALAAANIGFAAKNAADALKAGQGSTINGKENQIATKTDADGKVTESRDANAADKAGGINLAISIGSSKNESKTVQTSDRARRSTVTAGNNLTVIATGAGQGSDITVQGSTLQAGNRVALSAQDELKLLAAKNTADQHSTNKSKSGSVGISIGTDGLLFTASASGATDRSLQPPDQSRRRQWRSRTRG
jgi:filamentous hemagglutinin